MQVKDSNYYKNRLTALRNALDEVLGEMDEETEEPAPRIRRNLKQERVEQHEINYASGTWRKPAQLKKKK